MIKDRVFSGAKLGFIGVGNMGGALVRAARKNTPSTAICVANRSPEKAKALADEIPCRVKSNAEIAAWAEDDFRSVNGQLQWIIAESLKRHGRNIKRENGTKTNVKKTTK